MVEKAKRQNVLVQLSQIMTVIENRKEREKNEGKKKENRNIGKEKTYLWQNR